MSWFKSLSPLSPLSPVLRGEGSGVRGFVSEAKPLTPTPLPGVPGRGAYASFSLALGLGLLLSGLAFAQRNAPSHVDPDPELERKSFQVADGFEVNLFAADPLAGQADADEFRSGRSALGRVQPGLSADQAGTEANDKIIILEDTKGVGEADKTTVFADGLLIPTGVMPGDGGVYVVDSTDLLHLTSSGPAAKPTSGEWSSPASAPRTRITWSTLCAGGRTECSISTSPYISIATSRRRTACAASTAAAPGNSGRRRCSWKSFVAACGIPGASIRPFGHRS